MNIDAPLNVQHFKTYELKKKHEHTDSFKCHNFKTKPPIDKWSKPYDRGLKNTGFVEKNDESSAVCWSFSEKQQRKRSQNRKKYNNSWIAKDHGQRGSFKCPYIL